MVAREVEQDLIKRDTARCLQWCADNKSKLRKLKSSMEFKLRLQVCILYSVTIFNVLDKFVICRFFSYLRNISN